MLAKLKRIAKPYVRKFIKEKRPIRWVKKGGDARLPQLLPGEYMVPSVSAYSAKIEDRVRLTDKHGAQPLWEGYEGNNEFGPTRMPSAVRTSPGMGNFYTSLVQQLKPNVVVEFGTAFGVSGMYFLAGMELNQKGTLFTFDPNDVWAALAKDNLSQLSERFKLTIGTFEENADEVLPQGETIDLAFIDAIHTKEFVIPQLEIVVSKSGSGTIVLLDDINFSDNMRECWEEVSRDDRFASSAAIGDRVGVLELA